MTTKIIINDSQKMVIRRSDSAVLTLLDVGRCGRAIVRLRGQVHSFSADFPSGGSWKSIRRQFALGNNTPAGIR